MIGNITISEVGGTYNEALKVEMQASKADLIIHYTLDGSAPTAASDIYSGPFEFAKEGTYTIRAIGINSNGMESEEICETYTISFLRPGKPMVSPGTGIYSEEITINISGVLEGVEVYYTLDGTVPTKDSAIYTEPIVLPIGNYVFNALAIDANGIESELVWRIYEYIPDTPYSYNAALVKVKNALISKDIMLDMEGNTNEGTIVKINPLGITTVGEDGKEYYIFQLTSEYNGMSETLNGYYAVATDDGAYLELSSVNINRDKQEQEQEDVSDN